MGQVDTEPSPLGRYTIANSVTLVTGIVDPVDLDLLDEAPGAMALSNLDGVLTGILVRPELTGPSEWLPPL